MDWSYEAWPSGEPYDWGNAARGSTKWDAIDYHVDLGCGKLKKGRIGIDRYAAPGVNITMDLNTLEIFGLAREVGGDAVYYEDEPHGQVEFGGVRLGGMLPFDDSSIESIISHHALEHISDGFLRLIDEVYRVLKPGGVFRAITPLFPSRTAVEDPDHVRYFMEGTWESFCGTPGNCWLESFSVPYTTARFEMAHKDHTAPLPPERQWGPDDARELRVALVAMK